VKVVNIGIGNPLSLTSIIKQPLNHIGSTAIPGILAKPIIDILVEIPGHST